MKLHLMSDLHLEFGPMDPSYEPPADAEVILLPGDIGTGVQGIRWAAQTFRLIPTIYVAGNHEFYNQGRYFSKSYRKMKEAAEGTDVIVLQNESVVIAGTRFIGTTLWTDLNLWGNMPIIEIQAQGAMNDYKLIMREPPEGMNWSNKPLLPRHTIIEHQIALGFLMDELAKNHDGPTVVLTHHAPSEESCVPEFARNPLNPCYASNLEQFVEQCGADLWVHGHIHMSKDYMIGETRIAVNTRGYVGETMNPNFDPNLILEV